MIDKFILILFGVILCINAIHMLYCMFTSESKISFFAHLVSSGVIGMIGVYFFIIANETNNYVVIKKENLKELTCDTTKFPSPVVRDTIYLPSDTLKSNEDTLYLSKDKETPYVLIFN